MSEEDKPSVSSAFFERLYKKLPDPWQFLTSPYEKAKYQATLEALPRPLYRSALEVGCSIGVLTREVAPRCRALLSVDFVDQALEEARARCKDLPQVRFEKRRMPDEFPAGSYDLILVSEIGYYLSKPDLLALQRAIVEHLEPGGHALLVHYAPKTPPAGPNPNPLTGDEVHEQFLHPSDEALRLRSVLSRREESYRLDLFESARPAQGGA